MVLEKRNAVSDWRDLIGPTDAEKAKISHPHRFDLLPNTILDFANSNVRAKMNIVVSCITWNRSLTCYESLGCSLILFTYNMAFSCFCSIRALCGKNSQKNCVHGSDSTSSAEREIKFFFKDVVSGLFSSPPILLLKLLPLSSIQVLSVMTYDHWPTKPHCNGRWHCYTTTWRTIRNTNTASLSMVSCCNLVTVGFILSIIN